MELFLGGRAMALKLIVGDQESGNPTLPVRWCLDRRDLEKLRENEIPLEIVFVLLVVAYEGDYWQDRQLIPLSQAMTYVGLSHPGRHRLIAKVVSPYMNTSKVLKGMRNNIFNRFRSGRYQNEVLNFDRDEMLPQLSYGGSEVIDEIIEDCNIWVEVDKGHFAPEPPAWLNHWINFWHEDSLRDQCHLRRRAIMAFTIQPPLVLFWLVMWECVAILMYLISQVLMGLRGVSPLLLLHPWETNPKEMFPKQWYNSEKAFNSIYTRNSEGVGQKWRLWFHPLFLVGLGLTIYNLYRLNLLINVVLGLAGLGMFLLVIIIVSAVLMVVGGYLFKRFFKEWVADLKRIRQEAKVAAQSAVFIKPEARETQYDRVSSFLACSNVPRLGQSATLEALPKEQQTIRLRFLDFKRQVCKPFAG